MARQAEPLPFSPHPYSSLQEVEDFIKPTDTAEAFVSELLCLLVCPDRMEWYVYGRSAYLQRRHDVALETIAHHHQLCRIHL